MNQYVDMFKYALISIIKCTYVYIYIIDREREKTQRELYTIDKNGRSKPCVLLVLQQIGRSTVKSPRKREAADRSSAC